jgi:DNA-binding response OmpR family regulator
MTDLDLTPTERKILGLLADGADHVPREIHALLVDDLGPLANIRKHLSRLRKKLRPHDQDIRFERVGPHVSYRLISLSTSRRHARDNCHRG